jgi:DNA transformation protein
MSADDNLLQILKETLECTGSISGRRMFGAVGVYFNGTFFAIIDDGAIYFKTSDETRASFEAEGSRAFSYMTKKGAAKLTSYWRLPERLLDDADELRDWAERSIAAAQVAAAKARTATPKSKAGPKAKSAMR